MKGGGRSSVLPRSGSVTTVWGEKVVLLLSGAGLEKENAPEKEALAGPE